MRRALAVFAVNFNHCCVCTQADGYNSVSVDEGLRFQLQIATAVHRSKEDNWCLQRICKRVHQSISSAVRSKRGLCARAPPPAPACTSEESRRPRIAHRTDENSPATPHSALSQYVRSLATIGRDRRRHCLGDSHCAESKEGPPMATDEHIRAFIPCYALEQCF